MNDGGSAGAGGVVGAADSPGGAAAGAGSETDSMIGNGDFRQGPLGWEITVSEGSVNTRFSNERLCVEGVGGANVTVGWPSADFQPITIEPGVQYTLSYRAASNQAGTMTTKVGLAASPYTELYIDFVDVDAAWQTYTRTFVADNGSDAAGLAFTFALSDLETLCLDDVSLVRE